MFVEVLKRVDRSVTNFIARTIASSEDDPRAELVQIMHERVRGREAEIRARGLESKIDPEDYSVDAFIAHKSNQPDIQKMASKWASYLELTVASGIAISGLIVGRNVRGATLGLAGGIIGAAVAVKEYNKRTKVHPN